MPFNVQDDRVYKAMEHAVSAEAAGGVAILDLDTNQYFSLNHVGAVVWASLVTGATRDSLVEEVSRIYGVEPSVCGPDIDALLRELNAANLVRSEGIGEPDRVADDAVRS